MTFVLFVMPEIIFATDAEAEVELDKAEKALLKNSFKSAADYYMAAKLYADSPDMKLEALKKAAFAYDKANQKYKEFLCLKELVTGFSDKIDFEALVKKEFSIGNEFSRGHRDVKLSWLPWIKGKNKSVEIYETVLKQAPFANFASSLKLRLGRMYLANDKHAKALDTFRKIIKEHPNTDNAKFARFELANALVQLSAKAGDGDGAYAGEAEEILRESLKKYPESPETKWLKQAIKDTNEVRAKRIYTIAAFYQSRKNEEAALRYYNDLLARYPSSTYAKYAKKYLKKNDISFNPPPFVEKEKIDYEITEFKPEPKVILVAPQTSGGKWLLPVEDLDLDGSNAEIEYDSKNEALIAAGISYKQKRAEIIAERIKRKKNELKRKQKTEDIQPETDEERIEKIINESCNIIQETEKLSEEDLNETNQLKKKKRNPATTKESQSSESDYEIIHETNENIEDTR